MVEYAELAQQTLNDFRVANRLTTQLAIELTADSDLWHRVLPLAQSLGLSTAEAQCHAALATHPETSSDGRWLHLERRAELLLESGSPEAQLDALLGLFRLSQSRFSNLERLSGLLRRAERWSELADVLQEALARADSEDRSSILVELAEV